MGWSWRRSNQTAVEACTGSERLEQDRLPGHDRVRHDGVQGGRDEPTSAASHRVTGEECGEPIHEHDVERHDQLHLDPAGDHSDRVAEEVPEDGRGQQDKRHPGRVDDREVGVGQVAIEQQSRGRVVDAVVVLEHAE